MRLLATNLLATTALTTVLAQRGGGRGSSAGKDSGSSQQRFSGPDDSCWTAGFDEAFCCDPAFGVSGHPQCWTDEFRFARCCGVFKKDKTLQDVKREAGGGSRNADVGADGEIEYNSDSGGSVTKITTPCDFIIVGAGSGGAALAAKLENTFRVCLIDVREDHFSIVQ
jgi:hypothetical protein